MELAMLIQSSRGGGGGGGGVANFRGIIKAYKASLPPPHPS